MNHIAEETADDPGLTDAIRAHAREVTGFVQEGMPAMMLQQMMGPDGMMGGNGLRRDDRAPQPLTHPKKNGLGRKQWTSKHPSAPTIFGSLTPHQFLIGVIPLGPARRADIYGLSAGAATQRQQRR